MRTKRLIELLSKVVDVSMQEGYQNFTYYIIKSKINKGIYCLDVFPDSSDCIILCEVCKGRVVPYEFIG